jgi:hypothetical protein
LQRMLKPSQDERERERALHRVDVIVVDLYMLARLRKEKKDFFFSSLSFSGCITSLSRSLFLLERVLRRRYGLTG